MKRAAVLLSFVGLILAPAVWGQTAGEGRVVVPARNSSRPREVNASLVQGSIVVKTYGGKEVIVETCQAGPDGCKGARPASGSVQGMTRLRLPARGLEVEEEDNVVTVRLRSSHDSDLVITVPAETSLNLKSVHGSISADGIHGEVDADSVHGNIRLTDISGAVVAHSVHGNLKVTMDRLDPARPLSFSTVHGTVDVTLPADARANVKFRSDRGEIYSDFEIALGGARTLAEKSDSPDGRFRVRIDRDIRGTINGGGVEASFYTLNGTISLRKKPAR